MAGYVISCNNTVVGGALGSEEINRLCIYRITNVRVQAGIEARKYNIFVYVFVCTACSLELVDAGSLLPSSALHFPLPFC